MKKWIVLLGSLFLVLCWSGAGLAEESDTATHDVTITVEEVAILSVDGDNVTFTLGEPEDAGDPPKETWTNNDDDVRLQYTSVVKDGETRSIKAQITNGSLPVGITLKVLADVISGDGTGSAVKPAVTISGGSAEDIITGIGTGWTGRGDNGAVLKYSVELDYEGLVTSGNETVTITYTLTTGSE